MNTFRLIELTRDDGYKFKVNPDNIVLVEYLERFSRTVITLNCPSRGEFWPHKITIKENYLDIENLANDWK